MLQGTQPHRYGAEAEALAAVRRFGVGSSPTADSSAAALMLAADYNRRHLCKQRPATRSAVVFLEQALAEHAQAVNECEAFASLSLTQAYHSAPEWQATLPQTASPQRRRMTTTERVVHMSKLVRAASDASVRVRKAQEAVKAESSMLSSKTFLENCDRPISVVPDNHLKSSALDRPPTRPRVKSEARRAGMGPLQPQRLF